MSANIDSFFWKRRQKQWDFLLDFPHLMRATKHRIKRKVSLRLRKETSICRDENGGMNNIK
jgi:hypothetical protein